MMTPSTITKITYCRRSVTDGPDYPTQHHTTGGTFNQPTLCTIIERSITESDCHRGVTALLIAFI